MRSEPNLDETLARLEALLGRLAGGRGPLDELVSDHEDATRLLEQAEAGLAAFAARLDDPTPPGGRAEAPAETEPAG